MAKRFWRGLLIAVIAYAQSQGQVNQLPGGYNTRSSSGLNDVLDDARRVPVEYDATILFLALDNVPFSLPKAERIRRLSDLLHYASSAYYPNRTVYGGNGNNAGQILTVEEELYLNTLRVDRLDIETSAIERLSKLAPEQAVAAFQDIQLPHAPTPCELSGVPTYEAYYTTLQHIAALPRAVLPAAGDSFIAEAADRLASPSALAGYLQMIQSLQADTPTWTLIGGKLARSFEGAQPTDRELAALDRHGELSTSLSTILLKLRASGTEAADLLQAYRDFLVRGLNGKKCSDFSLNRDEVRKEFENLRTAASARQVVRAIDAHEIVGTLGTAAKDDAVPFDERLRPAMQRLSALSEANRVRQYVDHESEPLQPDDQDIQEVRRISQEDYNNEDLCQLCRFLARQETLTTLISTLPKGEALQSALHEEIGFLQSSAVQQTNPGAWLFVYEHIISTARVPDRATAQTVSYAISKGITVPLPPSPEVDVIRSGLAASSDPLIRLLWRAEILIKPPYKTFAPLPPAS